MDNPTFTRNTHDLMQRYGVYLRDLDTQPVTIPIRAIVDYMMDSYIAACTDSPPLLSFEWARSSEQMRSTLEDFVSTRDCFFHHEGRMPIMEATFNQATYQPSGELFVEIHFGWSPPTVDFEGLQNVHQENRAFALKPKVHDGQDVRFETELGDLMPWNSSHQQFEGRWPPILASMAGAQRLEAYTLPLTMTAQILQTFPGHIKFERTITLTIPITIKRKPDTCSTKSIMSCSPAVRRPAFSCTTESPEKVSSTDTTPRAVADSVASTVADAETPPTYKELNDLLKCKAKTGIPASPLRLNSLSMAQL